MSLNLIKTYLVDEPGQKHLIWLDKWESQGFEYSSGRLLNGRVKSNYALMEDKEGTFQSSAYRETSLSFTCSLWGFVQSKKGTGRYVWIFHICLTWEVKVIVFLKSHTGTEPHDVKTIISIFMVFGSSLPSMKTLTELDMKSVIWPECNVQLPVPKTHK